MAANKKRPKKTPPDTKTERAAKRPKKGVKPAARSVAASKAKAVARKRSKAAVLGWETRRKNESKRKRLAAKEAKAFRKPKTEAVKPKKLPKVRTAWQTNKPLVQAKQSLKATIAAVALMLQRQHGIDPRIAKKVAQSYEDEIVEWKVRGLTATDIAIEIKQNLDQEGVRFQSTVERAARPNKAIEGQNAEIAAKLLELRNTILRHKLAHGYSPPVSDVWMTYSDAGRFVGFHKYVSVAEVLTHANLDRIVADAVAAARLVWAQHQVENVRMYSAIEMYEYGKEQIGSHKHMYMSDSLGEFAYSYQGHKGVPPERYERAIRRKLRDMLNIDSAATVIESITVKSFVPSERVIGRA